MRYSECFLYIYINNLLSRMKNMIRIHCTNCDKVVDVEMGTSLLEVSQMLSL